MAAETKNLYNKEKYTVEFDLDDEHTDDVTVGVNGMFYRIKRGEPVEVPAEVYEVLMNQKKMDRLAAERQRKLLSKE